MNISEKIPIFPLGVVLLPEMLMPLHIFEERYKTMIGECLDAQKEFGIVYYDGAEIKSVGCMAKITQVIKRYPDGRMDILTNGTRRFHIEQIYEDMPYQKAQVAYFEDSNLDDPQVSDYISDQAKDLLNQIAKLSKISSNTFSAEKMNPQKLSFLIAGIKGFSYDEKQEFLEMQSSIERLEKGIEGLTNLVERLKISDEMKKIIDGNGHLPQLLH
jgi:ATP-dependent Lon protease